MIFISPQEAADQLGVSIKTVRRMIQRGDLPARRLGPRLLGIRVSDLETVGTPIIARRRRVHAKH